MRRYPALLFLLAIGFTLHRAWLIGHLGIDPYVDEAYYWGWSQALDWGYYSKPPLIALAIRASEALLGHTLLALKLPSLLCYPLAAALIYLLGARMFSAQAGFWAGLAFLTLPLVSALGLFVSTDALLLMFWALGLLALVRALESRAWRHWLLVGAAFGLGMMSKYTMAAFAGSAFLVMLALPEGRRQLLSLRPWAGFVLGVAIFAPNLWWNVVHDFPTFRHTAEITRLEQRGWAPDEFAEFIGAQWLAFGLLLFPVLLWACAASRRLWSRRPYRILLLMVLPLLLLVSAQALTGRANGNWAAPAYVAASVLVPAFLLEAGRTRLMAAAVVANVMLATAVQHWPDIAAAAGIEMSAKKDPYKRARGWSALADQLAPLLARDPQAIVVARDRETLAHVIYRLQPLHIASWNPSGGVMDHYDLTTELTPGEPRAVIFLSESPQIDSVATRFERATPLGEARVTVHPDLERRLYAFRLEGFKGYE